MFLKEERPTKSSVHCSEHVILFLRVRKPYQIYCVAIYILLFISTRLCFLETLQFITVKLLLCIYSTFCRVSLYSKKVLLSHEKKMLCLG